MRMKFESEQERSQDYELWVEDVRAKVDEAKQEADRGDVLLLDTVMAQLQQKFSRAIKHHRGQSRRFDA
jgi:hypothetical protein